MQEGESATQNGPRRRHWVPSEATLLGVSAIVVGVTAGLLIYAFKRWIEAVHELVQILHTGSSGALGAAIAVIAPAVGGLVVGVVAKRFLGVERYHGVAGMMEAVALGGGRLRYRRMPLKALLAGVAIGTGASVGPEDPSVQIGSNVGSFLGQKLHLSDDRIRALVAAGAAGGIAAAFNAPIAGVFFALEILLAEVGGGALGVVLLASVCSAVVTHALVGEHPAFEVPSYALNSGWELAAYLGLGLLAGLVSGLYVTSLYAASDGFQRARMPRWLSPALAGLAVGAVGWFLPEILGVGYEGVEAALTGKITVIGTLLVLLVAKMAMTSLCIGSGFPGGVFAPALFLGAMLGAAVGQVLAPFGIEPAAYAIVGMGAVLAGSVHAPLTAILLLFEMTRDYRIMPPAMLAVAVSLFVARRVRHESVYTLGLARKGIRLDRGRDVEVLQGLTVGEVMRRDAPTVHEDDPARAAMDTIQRTRHLGLAVVNSAGDLVGIVAAQDVDRASAAGKLESVRVSDVCTRNVLVAYPDESLGTALHRMSVRDVGRLPVVDRDAPTRLVGMLRRSDVIRAYDVALTRRAMLRHRVQQARISAVTEAAVQEFLIEPGAACDGKRIAEVPWPVDSLIASVRRGGRLMLPHGTTVLRSGDTIAVVTEGDAAEAVHRLCAAPSTGE
jgi:CIC family chloride channel protein